MNLVRRWSWDAEVGGAGKSVGIDPLALGGADFVDAGKPEGVGVVEAFEDGAQVCGAVSAQPLLLVHVAELRVAVGEVLRRPLTPLMSESCAETPGWAFFQSPAAVSCAWE